MSKILILAPSGFGKSSSIGNIPDLGIKGLDPKTTYLISITTKDLPFKGSKTQFPVTTVDKISGGRRICCKNAAEVVNVLEVIFSNLFIKN